MNWRQQDGFTLIEMLVAMVVTAIVLLSAYSVFGSITKVERRLQGESALYHQTRVFFDRLGREVRGAYFQRKNTRTSFTGEKSNISFSTTVSSPNSAGYGGMSMVSYRLEERDGSQSLLRSETPLGGITLGTVREYVMLSGLSDLTVRYYDNGNWADSWNSGLSNSVPQMVEISLTYGEVGTEFERNFVSAIELPMAP